MKKLKKILVVIFLLIISISTNVKASTNPGEIYVNKTATSINGRSANVTLEVSGNSYEQLKHIDLVLVLDRSSSMNKKINDEEITKIKATKDASISLINKLFSFKNASNNIRIGIVAYGTNILYEKDLTNDKNELIKQINNITDYIENEGTNIDIGLNKAYKMLNKETNQNSKYVVLLSDGKPTYFTDNNDIIRGAGSSDSGLCYINDIWYKSWDDNNYDTKEKCNNKSGLWYTPSSEALAEATIIKQNSFATIYTVGFNPDTTAKNLLKQMATSDNDYFNASTSEQLLNQFNSIANNINLLANDAIVTDIIPDKFNLDEKDLESRYGLSTIVNDTTKKYKDILTVQKNNDGTTKLIWNIGSIDASNSYKLTYKVDAKEPFYGNMYTNVEATLDATATLTNPFYKDKINIKYNKPAVPINSVTNDDNYTISRGKEINIDKTNGLLKNDYAGNSISLQKDNGVEVNDSIIIVKNSLTKGKIEINNDGSFKYIADDTFIGEVTLKYFVRTIINDNGKETILDSNISTVTFNIEGTGKVVARYVYISDGKLIDINPKETVNLEDKIGNDYKTIDKTFYTYKFIKLTDDSEPIAGEYKDGTHYVIRVYEKENAKVENNLTKESDGIITVDNKLINYNINFESIIDNYQGNASLTIVDYLPYEIDINKSDIAGGVYNNSNKTITWNIDYKDIDTSKEKYILEFNKILSLSFVNIDKTTSKIKNEVNAILTLENTKQKFEIKDDVLNEVDIKGKVIIRYIDEKGNLLNKEKIMEDHIGNIYESSKIDLDGYKLKEILGNEKGFFKEEDTIITYVYKANKPSVMTGVFENKKEEIALITTFTILIGAILLRKIIKK